MTQLHLSSSLPNEYSLGFDGGATRRRVAREVYSPVAFGSSDSFTCFLEVVMKPWIDLEVARVLS